MSALKRIETSIIMLVPKTWLMVYKKKNNGIFGNTKRNNKTENGAL
jgi:hypothetical protein